MKIDALGGHASKRDGSQAVELRAETRTKGRSVPHRSKTASVDVLAPLPSPKSMPLQLATLGAEIPRGDDWIYELKLDGYRARVSLEKGHAQICSRNGVDWTARFPQIREAIEALPAKNAVLDGEICAVDDKGRTRFQDLQNALSDDAVSGLQYFVFDLLFIDGVDVRSRPLLDRKAMLASLLRDRPPPLSYVTYVDSDEKVDALYAEVCKRGLEGLIAKRRDRPYEGGRGRDWMKVKCVHRQEVAIVGFTKPAGARQGFGALLLGVNDDEGLRYVGKVGTGFSRRSLSDLSTKLRARIVSSPAVRGAPRMRDATWIAPSLVCEVSFTEWTRDGALRHPSFIGLREDKAVSDVVREGPMEEPTEEEETARTRRAAKRTRPAKVVHISHPERVVDSSSGITKLDVARYIEAVTPLLLPYAAKRPLSLVRCPDGIDGPCFFQKERWAGAPAVIHDARAAGQEVLYVEDGAGLQSLIQFGTIELHGWGVRLPDAAKPDWLVMDLDPDEALPFARVVDAALAMRETLASIGLKSFVKTTGGKGLHVVAPFAPTHDYRAVKAITQSIAEDFARREPRRYTASMAKRTRAGRIFIDYLRNGEGATAVLPYSPRKKPGITIAMPVAWKDLSRVDPRDFTTQSALAILAKRKSDPWAEFFDLHQSLPPMPK